VNHIKALAVVDRLRALIRCAASFGSRPNFTPGAVLPSPRLARGPFAHWASFKLG
jgi:hypothetical protein